MDLKLKEMSDTSKLKDWTAASTAYAAVNAATGKSIKTLYTSLASETVGLATYNDYAAYYTTTAWADTFATSALAGSGEFLNWDESSRRELLTKGTAYNNVFQYVAYRLRKGVSVCVKGGANGALDWDVAWALFAGSLEGATGSGGGKSIYALGDKRCPQFNTCKSGTALATNNEKARMLWQEGSAALAAKDCFKAAANVPKIVSQMSVGMVQGAIREAWEVDRNPGGGWHVGDGVVEVAEGWAFLTAVLPQLAKCDAPKTKVIRDNMWLNAKPHAIEDGFGVIKSNFESMYACLGITCADVGGMRFSNGTQIPGMEPCGITTPVAAKSVVKSVVKSAVNVDADVAWGLGGACAVLAVILVGVLLSQSSHCKCTTKSMVGSDTGSSA